MLIIFNDLIKRYSTVISRWNFDILVNHAQISAVAHLNRYRITRLILAPDIKCVCILCRWYVQKKYVHNIYSKYCILPLVVLELFTCDIISILYIIITVMSGDDLPVPVSRAYTGVFTVKQENTVHYTKWSRCLVIIMNVTVQYKILKIYSVISCVNPPPPPPPKHLVVWKSLH